MADGGVMYCLEIMECMLEGLSITFFHCCLSSASTIRMYVLCRTVGLLLEENQTFINTIGSGRPINRLIV